MLLRFCEASMALAREKERTVRGAGNALMRGALLDIPDE